MLIWWNVVYRMSCFVKCLYGPQAPLGMQLGSPSSMWSGWGTTVKHFTLAWRSSSYQVWPLQPPAVHFVSTATQITCSFTLVSTSTYSMARSFWLLVKCWDKFRSLNLCALQRAVRVQKSKKCCLALWRSSPMHTLSLVFRVFWYFQSLVYKHFLSFS